MKIFNIFKKIGLLSIYLVGGAVTVGGLGLSIASIVYDKEIKNWVVEYAGTSQRTLNQLVNQFDSIVNQVDTTKDELVSYIDYGQNIIKEQQDSLKDFKNQLTSNGSTLISSLNEKGSAEIVNTIDSVITKLDEFNRIVDEKVKNQIENGYQQVDAIVRGELVKNIKSIIGEADSILAQAQDPNSDLWKFYGIVSKTLLGVSASIIIMFLLGYFIRLFFERRVDGVWIKKTSFKKDLTKHVLKILKKYPALYRVIDEF